MTFGYILLLSVGLIGSNSFLLSPLLPEVAAAFDVEPTTVAWAITAYNASTALSALLLSSAIDRHGPRTVLNFSYALLAVGTVLSMLAPNLAMLILGQALCGMGAGIALPSIYLLASLTAPKGQEARMVGRVLTGWSVALVAGIPASTLLSQAFGWRACYAALAVICLIVFLASCVMRPKVAWRPSVTKQDSSLWAPFFIERAPILLAMNTLYMAAFYGVYSFLGIHLKDVYGVTTVGAGYAVLAYGLGFGLATFGDPLIERLGVTKATVASLGGIAAIYLALAIQLPSAATLYAVCVLWGLFNHFGLNVIITMLGQVNSAMRGQVMGMNSVVTYMGGSLGTSIVAYIYSQSNFHSASLFGAFLITIALMIFLLSVVKERLDPSWMKAKGGK